MLTLPIKAKWFDMIAAREKLEDYRAMSPYYDRIVQRYGLHRRFFMRFRNGYRKDSPLMECAVTIEQRTGEEAWGATPEVRYNVFCIHSLRIIKPRIKQ